MEPKVDLLLHEQGGAIAASQLAMLGVTAKKQRKLLEVGDLIALRRSIYTAANLWHPADQRARHRIAVAGALLIRRRSADVAFPPTLVGGHESAAFVWELIQPAQPTNVHLVCAERRRRTGRSGVLLRPAALPADHVTYFGSVPFTSVGRTAVDLMRHRSGRDAVILADAALRTGVTRLELRRIVEFCAGWKGSVQAVEAVEFATPLAESPAESLARWVLHVQGLPAPQLQVEIFDNRGFVGRVDLLFPEFRTILEVDGRLKYGGSVDDAADAVWREKVREDRLRDAGYEVVRTTWNELVQEPDRLHHRILAAFVRSSRRAG